MGSISNYSIDIKQIEQKEGMSDDGFYMFSEGVFFAKELSRFKRWFPNYKRFELISLIGQTVHVTSYNASDESNLLSHLRRLYGRSACRVKLTITP